jgi:CHAD domain-containing protein
VTDDPTAQQELDEAEPDAAPTTRALPVLGPRPDPIAAADDVATAGRVAMWPHLERLLARETSLLDPDRPDDLRRYRVATRRLRAALRWFGDAYPDREVRPLRRGLGELADALGSVRDLDLRIADVNAWALERGEGDPASVGPLVTALVEDRARALHALDAHVATRRHGRLLRELVAFVEAPVGHRRTRPRAIGDRIASRAWSSYEDLRAYAPVVRWADVATLHRIRIAAKRLRDGLDLVGDLVGPARERLTEPLVRLQDHLGALNDAAVAGSAVRDFLERRHASLAPDEQVAITAYLADRERDVARLRRTVLRAWRPVAGIAFARRLGRLVVVPPPAQSSQPRTS